MTYGSVLYCIIVLSTYYHQVLPVDPSVRYHMVLLCNANIYVVTCHHANNHYDYLTEVCEGTNYWNVSS